MIFYDASVLLCIKSCLEAVNTKKLNTYISETQEHFILNKSRLNAGQVMRINLSINDHGIVSLQPTINTLKV